jgi:hypothetical protein
MLCSLPRLFTFDTNTTSTTNSETTKTTMPAIDRTNTWFAPQAITPSAQSR